MDHAANGNTASAAAHSAAVPASQDQSGLWALALGSVGVVYGDIGTSPLYAFREAVTAAAESGPVTRDTVLGVLSLILWALIIVVTIKYVLILLRADNNGEGGTLSLTALATRALGRRTQLVFLLGVIGAAMFLGDSVITPAISVLSAVEGLKLVTPAFEHYVVPLTIVILVVLFAVQSRGTARVASLFGPVMVVWFVAIAIAGLLHIRDDPGVLWAANPVYGIKFLLQHGRIGLVTLGARLPGGHRRRGALCRSRPFRPQADPARLVRSRAAGADRSTISGRARWCSPIRRRSRIRSTASFPTCCCCPWSCWRPPRP